jgi:hypothetical protein
MAAIPDNATANVAGRRCRPGQAAHDRDHTPARVDPDRRYRRRPEPRDARYRTRCIREHGDEAETARSQPWGPGPRWVGTRGTLPPGSRASSAPETQHARCQKTRGRARLFSVLFYVAAIRRKSPRASIVGERWEESADTARGKGKDGRFTGPHATGDLGGTARAPCDP